MRKVDRHRITSAEYEEAPELTPEQIANAIVSRGGVPIKRGRPRLDAPKEAVKIRLDRDVVAFYRETGRGWQTRINNDLRRASVDRKTKRRA